MIRMIVPHTTDTAGPSRTVRKAVVPAAGLGTRFLPATKATPKEMLPVVDKPAIQYVVEEAAAAGLDDVLMVTGRHKRAIEDHFDNAFELEQVLAAKGDAVRLDAVRDPARLASIHHIRQGEPLGLGHAVLCARRHVGDQPFAVLLGDDLIDPRETLLSTMLDVRDRYAGSVVALMEVPREQIHLYGCAAVAPTEEEGLVRVTGLVEKPSPRTRRAPTRSSAAMSSTPRSSTSWTGPRRGAAARSSSPTPSSTSRPTARSTASSSTASATTPATRRTTFAPWYAWPATATTWAPSSSTGSRGSWRSGRAARGSRGGGWRPDNATAHPTTRRSRGRPRTQPFGRSVHTTVISPVTAPSARRISIVTGNSGRSPASSWATTSEAGRPRVAVAVTGPIASLR